MFYVLLSLCVVSVLCVIFSSITSLHVVNIFLTQLHNHSFSVLLKKKETNTTVTQNKHFYIIIGRFQAILLHRNSYMRYFLLWVSFCHTLFCTAGLAGESSCKQLGKMFHLKNRIVDIFVRSVSDIVTCSVCTYADQKHSWVVLNHF